MSRTAQAVVEVGRVHPTSTTACSIDRLCMPGYLVHMSSLAAVAHREADSAADGFGR